ncbi:plasmepsin-2, variant 2 [Clonorchis sinensis]|uniref:Plasmepsin-2, variant 2 n=1 Tax=Clonorchis sinensis TaxID=79923 RepID=A0A8T1MZY6_CLOSI|nr:plasmepsin-2, variant 2 [Clonorchis sinensis]
MQAMLAAPFKLESNNLSRSAPHVFSSRTKYDKNSPTRISMEKEYRTSYSGERYKGNIVMDNILIAGCPVEHFIFAEMIYSSIVVDASEGFDGIVGMRKPQGDQKRGDLFRITLIDHLLATGSVAEAIFTFRFCGRPGVRQFSWFENGNLILGGVREDFHHLPIVYVPTYQSKQWTVFIDSIVYGDVVLCKPCRVRVDTGASVTHAPVRPTNILLQNSVVEVYDGEVLHVPVQNLPYLLPIYINIRSHTFTLQPQQLVREINGVYAFGIEAMQKVNENQWLFGISFLRHFHTIFDQQNNQVGFAAVNC